MIDAQRTCQFDRSIDQRVLGVGIVRGGSTVDAERQRHQRMAEQAAPDLGQRQHAADRVAALGDQVMAAMPKDVLEDLAPADAMEERRRRGSASTNASQRAASPAVERAGRDRAIGVARAVPTVGFGGRLHHARRIEEHPIDTIPAKIAKQARRRGAIRCRFR